MRLASNAALAATALRVLALQANAVLHHSGGAFFSVVTALSGYLRFVCNFRLVV